MFGFLLQHDRTKKPMPTPHHDPTAQPLWLVSKEDIYSQGNEAVLLLKKGACIEPALLPKFERYGARASQFEIRTAKGDRTIPIPEARPAGHQDPITTRPRNLPNHRKSVLVLAPDPKQLARLTDCLFVCGVPLTQIQPLRVANQLAWTLEKHHPHVLLVDYDLPGEADGLSVLEALDVSAVSRVILAVNWNRLKKRTREEVETWAADRQVRLLEKPVSRHALSDHLT